MPKANEKGLAARGCHGGKQGPRREALQKKRDGTPKKVLNQRWGKSKPNYYQRVT